MTYATQNRIDMANTEHFAIYNADGTPFHDLVLRKGSYTSQVMSLSDKITGDVYYKDNTLAVTMQEYIEYNGNKYVLVDPPTIVREGMVSDNKDLNGMTKYSFEFYHPMYMLANFPFSDIATKTGEEKYLSQNKEISWIGNIQDFVAKLNANLHNTRWVARLSDTLFDPTTGEPTEKAKTLSEVLSFSNASIADALKTAYDTWSIPFIIDDIKGGEEDYDEGKTYLILFGLPSNTIVDESGNQFVFRFGQGVGLKNNSRNPKNNKIVTRIAGRGSTDNIPYGYPQIVWYGDSRWEYTRYVNDDPMIDSEGKPQGIPTADAYPIYDGIVNGRYVRLIKHPFTRTTLMPSIYSQTVFNKVSPYAEDGGLNPNYSPNLEIIDYYDATIEYPNPIVADAPSYHLQTFEEIKPRFGENNIQGVSPFDEDLDGSINYSAFSEAIDDLISSSTIEAEKKAFADWRNVVRYFILNRTSKSYSSTTNGGTYAYTYKLDLTDKTVTTTFTSATQSLAYVISFADVVIWDDSMNEDGEYTQKFFRLTLPQLDFDLYACAAITQEMSINMRSGACIGCTFPVEVDWEDYKANFYDKDGNFAPTGQQRNYDRYPDSSTGQITIVVKKDIDTFGKIMPNIYQQPTANDTFVILGISLPLTYVSNAESELDDAMKEYMLENNIYHYDYPLKFDEYFLETHANILSQIRNNAVVRFQYADNEMDLYIKEISIRWDDKNVLPQYDITLADDIEIVLNQIGQVTDDVSRMRVQLGELQKYYSDAIISEINNKLSRVSDDIAHGRITFQQGLDALGAVVFGNEIKSNNYVKGMGMEGRGWRIDQLGNAQLESLRVRSYLEVVELLINRLQAQEGDTIFSDNDQVDFVEEREHEGVTYYVLSLKEKWDGYFTAQKKDNILKGIINTLAANNGHVTDIDPSDCVESDGDNKFFTSWMKVIGTATEATAWGETFENNQIAVILYDDADVPAQKNFAPCELMAIARWGCDADPDTAQTEGERESILRRQRLFSISASDGRITKLVGVRTPILQDTNYGTTLGVLPDFVKNWAAVASRIADGRDYLYAQGIVVSDFIKVDALGNAIATYVDKGEWQDNTAYLHNSYNAETLQYETHDVWHNGAYWRCEVAQPYQGVYYEPTDNSPYWTKLLRSGSDGTSQQNIYTRATSPVQPSTSQDDDNLPTGWSRTPQGVSSTYKNEYISTRTKTNGVWSAWSVPALFSHFAEDGTSISIKGTATGIVEWGESLPSLPNDGEIWLMNNDDSDDIEKRESGSWEGYSADEGDGYVYEGDLWIRTANDTPTQTNARWQNVGRIKGDDGDAGQNAVRLDLTSQMDTIACDSEGKVRQTKIVTTIARLYDGNTAVGGLSWPTVTLAGIAKSPTILGGGASYSWTIDKDTELANASYTASISVVYNGVTYSAQLRLARIDSTDIYQLEPSLSAIAFAYSVSQSAYIPATIQINCGYTKTGADGTESFSGTDINNLWTTGGAKYNIMYRFRKSDNTTVPANAWNWAKDLANGTLIIPCTTDYIAIEYIMTSASGYAQVTDDNIIDRESIPIIKGGEKGEQGQRGKTGKFYYFGGEWESIAQDTTFNVTDNQTPFFSINGVSGKNYFVWIGREGALAKSDMGTPTSASENWEIMTNDFKYLITEAIFGQYAHFGSAIINGDWLISARGKIDGVISSNYEAFDPSDPQGLETGHFAPTFCVDLLTGNSYMNDAVLNNATLSGTLDGVTGTFKRLEGYKFPNFSGETAIDLLEVGIMNLYASDQLHLQTDTIYVRHPFPQTTDPQGNIHYHNTTIELGNSYVRSSGVVQMEHADCRQFSALQRNTLLVTGANLSYYLDGYSGSYPDFVSEIAERREAQDKTWRVVNCTNVSVHSYILNYSYKFTVDTIVFNCAVSTLYELRMDYTQRIFVINGGETAIGIISGGTPVYLQPKEAMYVVRLPNTNAFLKPKHNDSAVGAGILTFKL